MKKTYKKWMALLAAGTLLISTPAAFFADSEDSAAAGTVVTNEASAEESKPVGEAAPAEKTEAPAEVKSAAPAETKSEAPAEKKAEAPAETKSEAPAETKAEAPAETKSEAPAETKSEAPAETKSETPAETKVADEAKPSESKADEKSESKEEAKSSDENASGGEASEGKSGDAGKSEDGKTGDKKDDASKDGESGDKKDDASKDGESGDKKEDASKDGESGDKKEDASKDGESGDKKDDASKDGESDGKKDEKAEDKKDDAAKDGKKSEESKKDDKKAEESKKDEAGKTDEKADEKEEKTVTQFTGSARIERVGSGDLYEGDEVTLRVSIENANRSDYRIRWEEKAESTWVPAAEGSEYRFKVDKVKAGHVFRAVLSFAEEGVKEVSSNELRLPALKEKEEEKEEEKTVEQFTGSVMIGRAGDGDLYDGDNVTLTLSIENANRQDYHIRWEARAEVSWQVQQEGGESFSFEVNEARAGHTYRAVLSFDEEGVKEVASNELKLPALTVKEEEKAEEAAVERSVSIATSGNADTKVGDTITLTSSLTGFDGVDAISYQWKCDRGNGFEAVAGANGSSYSFELTEESMNWLWQLDVTCTETK